MGHLDRVRRRHRHGARLRRLRHRAPRLHPQQGRVPPARPPRDPHEPARLRPRRARGHHRPRPASGQLWKVPIYFWRWSPLAAARGGALRRGLRRGAAGSSCRPPSSRSGGRAPSRRCGASPRGLAALEKALVWILALGLLLPTMHQSSLGTMMLLPAPKLHPLWYTPWLPLLFLVNCLVMGYGVVVLEATPLPRRLRPPPRDRRCWRRSRGCDGSGAAGLRGLPPRRPRAARARSALAFAGDAASLFLVRAGLSSSGARPGAPGAPAGGRARPGSPAPRCSSCSAAPSTASTSTSSPSGRAELELLPGGARAPHHLRHRGRSRSWPLRGRGEDVPDPGRRARAGPRLEGETT